MIAGASDASLCGASLCGDRAQARAPLNGPVDPGATRAGADGWPSGIHAGRGRAAAASRQPSATQRCAEAGSIPEPGVRCV